jgi:hypothetical protein
MNFLLAVSFISTVVLSGLKLIRSIYALTAFSFLFVTMIDVKLLLGKFKPFE